MRYLSVILFFALCSLPAHASNGFKAKTPKDCVLELSCVTEHLMLVSEFKNNKLVSPYFQQKIKAIFDFNDSVDKGRLNEYVNQLMPFFPNGFTTGNNADYNAVFVFTDDSQKTINNKFFKNLHVHALMQNSQKLGNLRLLPDKKKKPFVAFHQKSSCEGYYFDSKQLGKASSNGNEREVYFGLIQNDDNNQEQCFKYLIYDMLAGQIANVSPIKELEKNSGDFTVLEQVLLLFVADENLKPGISKEKYKKIIEILHPIAVKNLRESGVI